MILIYLKNNLIKTQSEEKVVNVYNVDRSADFNKK